MMFPEKKKIEAYPFKSCISHRNLIAMVQQYGSNTILCYMPRGDYYINSILILAYVWSQIQFSYPGLQSYHYHLGTKKY